MKRDAAAVAAVFGLIAVMGIACVAQADYIAGVTVDSVSSEISTRLANYTIDSDASFDPVAGTLDEGERGWMSQGTDYAPTIVYNLGATYQLDQIHIWNWNQAGGGGPGFAGQGFKDIRIELAGADKAFSTLGTYALEKAPGADGYTGQSITGIAATAQYVKIAGLDTWFATDGFYNRGGEGWMNEAGLGKVQFSAVPEPSALVLGCAALFGLLAYAWRRRKSS